MIASPGPQLAEFARQEGIQWRALPMRRSISPCHDAGAIRQLTGILRELAPHIVHAHTPKAGLVGMAAATLGPCPAAHLPTPRTDASKRPTAGGVSLLKAAESLTCRLAHRVICVSPSLRQKGLDEGLFCERRATVLAHGSVNGLDVDQFRGPERSPLASAGDTRQRLGIPEQAICLGFVGRLVRDKGVVELHAAWQQLRVEFPRPASACSSARSRTRMPSRPKSSATCDADPRVHLTGLDWHTRGYYAAMDVFTLPSHREGLGHVLLEAGAMELPVVSCHVTGCVDAVLPGQTGTLVPAGDAGALAAAIAGYLRDPSSPPTPRARGSPLGRNPVSLRRPIWRAVQQEYLDLLRSALSGAASGLNVARAESRSAGLSGKSEFGGQASGRPRRDRDDETVGGDDRLPVAPNRRQTSLPCPAIRDRRVGCRQHADPSYSGLVQGNEIRNVVVGTVFRRPHCSVQGAKKLRRAVRTSPRIFSSDFFRLWAERRTRS